MAKPMQTSKNEMNSNENQAKKAKQSETTTEDSTREYIEGIDDLDDDVRAELPNQDHCTWFLNIIQIHAKKIAKQLLDEQKTQLFARMKDELVAIKTASKAETDELRRKIEELQRSDERKKNLIEQLQHELRIQGETIQETFVKVDNVEQMHYENDVQLVGLPESLDGTSDIKQVVELSREIMEQHIEEDDVKEVIRLGKRTRQKPRDVIVKFRSRKIREAFYSNRKKAACSENIRENTYINDRLTRYRKTLFYTARQLFKNKNVAAAWTQYGNVLIRETTNSPPRQIFSHKDLQIICNQDRIDSVLKVRKSCSANSSNASDTGDYNFS